MADSDRRMMSDTHVASEFTTIMINLLFCYWKMRWISIAISISHEEIKVEKTTITTTTNEYEHRDALNLPNESQQSLSIFIFSGIRNEQQQKSRKIHKNKAKCFPII